MNAKSRELESFAYSVAHDLKAPLRGIDGYSRLLLEEYAQNLDKEGRNFLHTIQGATDEMNQMIDDLLWIGSTGSSQQFGYLREDLVFTDVEVADSVGCGGECAAVAVPASVGGAGVCPV